jgi:hypothetical protein
VAVRGAERIVTRGDTVYIATADRIKLTWDNGATWRVITDAAGVTTTRIQS